MLVVSPVTSLMKDQVESFGSEVSKGIKYNQELMSSGAAKERVTPVTSKS